MDRLARDKDSPKTNLIRIATAVPPFSIDQRVAEASSRSFFASRLPNYERMTGVFASTGIERRYSVRPVSWFAEAHGWPDRTAAYLRGASVLFHDAVRKVLEAIEAALSLPRGNLDDERSIMRDFGNMSAPTVLFVLERAIARGLPPTTVLAALGPGFTASYAALEFGAA